MEILNRTVYVLRKYKRIYFTLLKCLRVCGCALVCERSFTVPIILLMDEVYITFMIHFTKSYIYFIYRKSTSTIKNTHHLGSNIELSHMVTILLLEKVSIGYIHEKILYPP